MFLLPDDISVKGNLDAWNKDEILNILPGQHLKPLEAKALHILGILLLNFEAAGHLLRPDGKQLAANYYLQAYLITCSSIELLGRCIKGDPKLATGSNKALNTGLEYCFGRPIETNHNKYEMDDLIALRNMGAHGQGDAIVNRVSVNISLDIELLNKFPDKLGEAYDRFYNDLLNPDDKTQREKLAEVGILPLHYNQKNGGNVLYPPIIYAYDHIVLPEKKPSQVLKPTDWRVYK